jgi:hypothetical protein
MNLPAVDCGEIHSPLAEYLKALFSMKTNTAHCFLKEEAAKYYSWICHGLLLFSHFQCSYFSHVLKDVSAKIPFILNRTSSPLKTEQ